MSHEEAQEYVCRSEAAMKALAIAALLALQIAVLLIIVVRHFGAGDDLVAAGWVSLAISGVASMAVAVVARRRLQALSVQDRASA